jgi:hypothetical protein
VKQQSLLIADKVKYAG